ncbi:MAG: family transcriptional regulator [Nocardioides sp.]|jgi:predicted NBD/HSP70 family sugar kinase|uniref:ROK family transcriptional regulator n=1 Tax=Nocardioides sp. TaxID=35761 RepID=UPI002622F811|nr:ROK family transcriptional regulator [Nocardioides sp.]MCW2832539.1 family transcriptional regulator [Nocardioides sp.]
MPPSPGSTASLRSANQQRVVGVLRAGGTVSQADIARQTGLAPATVSNIVRQLTNAGLVEVEPGSGRRGTTVELARAAGLVAGIDFGHSHVAVAIGDLTGQLIVEQRRRIDSGHAYASGLDQADVMVDALLAAEGLERSAVRTIGLGLPAPMTNGVVRTSAILPGWVGVNAQTAAQEALGAVVHTENDANLGALAEHRQGVGRGHDSSVFVKVSSGVGAGIVLNDQIFHGHGGTAGEIGHLTLDENGPVCRCGSRGCLEAYTSTVALQGMMQLQLPNAGFDDIVAEARNGNVSALRALEDAGLHLGWAIASIVNLLNPAIVVVGGDMARAGALLLEPARIGLRRHALDAVASTPVLSSELGERASLVGAVLIAAERTTVLTD